MNKIINNTHEGAIKAVELSDWLISRGISSLSTKEIAHLLGIPENQVSQRMASLKKRGVMATPARGLWIPIPPEYRAWGAPEPAAYLEDMMRFFDAKYCVGWLSAAALHGASHHAAQVFQIATSKHIRDRELGRSELQFFQRGYLDTVGITSRSLPRGRMQMASVATTLLMICDDVEICGGIDNVANIVIELAEETEDIDAVIEEICCSARAFPVAASRRLGWLLENFTDCSEQDKLATLCKNRNGSLSVLSSQSQRGGAISKRWHLEINREVVPDI
ncbi:MAG: type IV toxin-antitoxin system AbiEi family antitoxin [Raoultibacter sp.]